MDNTQLVEKMTRVIEGLSEKGGLKLFALNWRKDTGQWDIIVSADWVDYAKLRDNISDIFQEVKKEFNGQYALLFSGIHPLTTSEPFVESVTKAFSVPSGTVNLERFQLGDLAIEKMILFVSKN